MKDTLSDKSVDISEEERKTDQARSRMSQPTKLTQMSTKDLGTLPPIDLKKDSWMTQHKEPGLLPKEMTPAEKMHHRL